MILFLIISTIFSSSAQTITDTFESYKAGTWAEGSIKGPWITEYNGYGKVGIQQDGASNKVLFQKPMASTSPDETHASLSLSQQNFHTPEITYRSKVVKQLRTPKPYPWETAWAVWNYTHDHRFYYFALKTNGWELGKVDNTKKNPTGPECLWPQYLNCKYEGAQRYLVTANAPKVKIGTWDTLKVKQENNKLSVYVNNVLVVQFVDKETPYLSGKIGFYNEDAHVLFDNVSAK